MEKNSPVGETNGKNAYKILDELLGNVGMGIAVYDTTTRELIFANALTESSDEILRAINFSADRYFEAMESGHDNIKEYFDAGSGLWFSVNYTRTEWLDGRDAVACMVADITMRKKNQQKIAYQNYNDFLTGLYNRKKCENDLRKQIRICRENGTKAAFLFIDLDDFKNINDGLGHQYGDLLLQQIAAGIQSVAGLREHCYRMGGDEFGVIVCGELYDELDRTIGTIVKLFDNPWYLMETEYYCTMSMGVVEFPIEGNETGDIIKKADIAMYDSKLSGKNKVSFYQIGKADDKVKRLDIENNLRQAVADQCSEFVVFYQPIIDVKTGKCCSSEALVRWNSAGLGFVGPGEFIPLAEYMGLIVYIGDFVLEEACNQCRKWNAGGYPDFRINVNLSIVQLMQRDIISTIQHVFEGSGVDSENICLEITESMAINDMGRVLKIIDSLKGLGAKIALDDFGTGYSSLNYIKQLPFDIIKVDKTFIDDIVEDDYAQAFVRLIVDLSKTLNAKVCVEGVETKQQLDKLTELGVDYIQGYYFGKPVTADEFEKLHLPELL
ncbi:MAG: putative bifunctional diguanylate cyclase/phosphodiesterase [Lachnospiraceae bacterium]